MSRARSVLRVGMLIVVLGLAAFLVWWFFFTGGPEAKIRSAQKFYDQGVLALAANDGATAQTRFEESSLRSKEALEQLQSRLSNSPNMKPEKKKEYIELGGQAHFLRFLALKDYVYAEQMVKGNAIKEAQDSATGKRFRALYRIRSFDGQKYAEALYHLENAAETLPNEKEIQQIALRAELSHRPELKWRKVHLYSKNLLALDEKDNRALFMMARHDFEQPIFKSSKDHVGTPRQKVGLPLAEISVDKSQKNLETAISDKEAPYWRMIHLKAKIHKWRWQQALKENNEAEAGKQEKILNQLLFGAGGALATAKRGEGFKYVSAWDRDGALNLHLEAVDFAIHDLRNYQSRHKENLKKLKSAVDKTIRFCVTAPKHSPSFSASAVAETAVQALQKTQPFLATSQFQKDWKEHLKTAAGLAKSAVNEDSGTVEMFVNLAAVLSSESVLVAKKGNKKTETKLRNDAIKWLDDGIRVKSGQKSAQAKRDLIVLHRVAARMKLLLPGKDKRINRHLAFLKKSGDEQSKATVHLIEGLQAERDGRLKDARRILRNVLVMEKASAEQKFRAQALLTTVYMSLEEPLEVLSVLRELEAFFLTLKERTTQEQAWVHEFIGTHDDLRVLQIIAHLQRASQLIVQAKSKSNLTIPVVERIKGVLNQERAAKTIRAKIKENTSYDRKVRRTFARYYLFRRGFKEARKEVDALRRDYPESVPALQLDAALIEVQGKLARKSKEKDLDPVTRLEIDNLIQDFVKKNPEDKGGKYYWAVWLTRTGRPKEAVAYLKERANFPGAREDAFHAVLGIALFKSGERDESIKAFKEMTPSPTMYAALIKLAATPEEKELQMNKALSRYENNGLFQCWNASLLFNQDKYAAAARGFFKGLGIARVQDWARRGVQQSLFALTQRDPLAAKKVIEELLAKRPQEPTLLLSFAFVSWKMDNLGSPDDKWGRKKNMASALKEWDRIARPNATNVANIHTTKAEYWLLANRTDIARLEINRALAVNAKHPRALRIAVRLALMTVEPTRLDESLEHLKTLEETAPKSPEVHVLRGDLYRHKNDLAQSLASYEKSVATAPDHANGYLGVVNVLEHQKKLDTALAWTKKWRQKFPNADNPNYAEVRLLAKNGKVAEAEKVSAQFLQAQLKRLKDEHASKKKYAAWSDKKKKKHLRTSEMNYQVRIAAEFRKAAAWPQAEKRLQEVKAKEPSWLLAHSVESDIHIKRKDWPQAVKRLRYILGKNENHWIAANNLAWILATKLNKPAEALEVANKVRRSPYSKKMRSGKRLDASFLDTLGVAYRALKEKKLYPEMRDLFEDAVIRHPRDPRMFYYLGHAYAKLGDRTKAGDMFQSAISLASGHPTLDKEDLDQVSNDARRELKLVTAKSN